MADDITSPQLINPINESDNIPSQEEITEKPYYNNDLNNPKNQNLVNNPNNIQPQYKFNDIQYNYEEQAVLPNYEPPPKSKKKPIILSIILFVVFIIDIIVQIIIGFNLFIIIDDVLILIMGIIYLLLTLKGKLAKNNCLAALTIFIMFVGFSLRILGMIHIESVIIAIIDLILLCARAAAQFMFIPESCD